VLHSAVALLIAGGLLRVLTGTPSRALEHPVARYFGAISFGLYLWHFPILDHGRELQSETTLLPPLLWSIVVVAGLLTVSVVAATCSYVLVERPFMRLAATTRATPGTRAEAAQGVGTLGRWPSRRSSVSRPSTA
jgi:peptidoglycan/LPS O-acetylase OafA/YrhL